MCKVPGATCKVQSAGCRLSSIQHLELGTPHLELGTAHSTHPIIMNYDFPITVRPIDASDLLALEWEGEYTHFRRQFEMAYSEYLAGNGIPWVLIEATTGVILGQVFVLFRSRHRGELADGTERAYLYSVRVKTEFRGLGLGGRMMDIVEEDLYERGFAIATLNVARDNPGAYRFYVRRGYRTVAPDPGQWAYLDHLGRRRFVDEPAWRMEKILGPGGQPE